MLRPVVGDEFAWRAGLVYWKDGAKANQSYSIRDKIPFGMGAKVSEMDTTRRYPEASGRDILRDSREPWDRDRYVRNSRRSCASVCIVSTTDVDIECSRKAKEHNREWNISRASWSKAGVVGRELLASRILCANIRRPSDNRNNQELHRVPSERRENAETIEVVLAFRSPGLWPGRFTVALRAAGQRSLFSKVERYRYGST